MINWPTHKVRSTEQRKKMLAQKKRNRRHRRALATGKRGVVIKDEFYN